MSPAPVFNDCCEVFVHQDTAMSLTTTKKSPENLLKGVNFFRKSNHANRGIFATKRKSAVELLEASKAEYVKSSSVLQNRQELKHPEVLHVGTRPKSAVISNQPTRLKSEHGLPPETVSVDTENNITVKRKHEDKPENNNGAQRKNSNVSVRSGSVNRDICNSCESSKINKSENQRLVSPVNSDKTPSSNLEFSANETHNNHHNSNMESKDKLKEKVSCSSKSKDFLKPTSYQHLSTSVTVLVEKRCSSPSTEFSNEISVLRRKKKPLHRSQSDLSGRHSRNSSDFSDLSSRLSRTSTELERFFNEMGIDKSVLDPMLKLQRHKDSDVFESVSSVDSAPHDRSSSSDISEHADKADKPETDKEIAERNTKQTSIVEKNARIIKWLCNVKKARHPNQQAS